MKIVIIATTLLLAGATSAMAESNNNHSHQSHDMPQGKATHAGHDNATPSDIMTNHGHDKNDLMFSYKYMRMEMDGFKSGTKDVTTQEILNDYVVAPLNMQMDMHMFGAMYGVSDKITAMAMIPYLNNAMEHQRANGTRFSSSSEGIGDLKLSLIAPIENNITQNLQGLIGISLPTGSIDKRNDSGAKLPYSMQLGSGTVDVNLGLTYTNNSDDWSWGGQAQATVRAGLNDSGYRLGNKYNAKGWVGRKVTETINAFTKINATYTGNITGSDDQLNAAMVPTANANNFGGSEVELGLGVNYSPKEFQGHELSLEFDKPVYQNLNGPQMSKNYTVMVNWRKAF